MRICLAVLLLSGCVTTTQIDYSRAPPADWPKMRVEVTHVSLETIGRYCNTAHSAGDRVLACASFAFDRFLCGIYLTSMQHEAELHERAHCAGYDHTGETAVRDAWERYKARGR